MLQNFKLQDIGLIITCALSLGGLMLGTGKVVADNEQQGRDLVRHEDRFALQDQRMDQLDKDQRSNDVAIARMQEGIAYLVERAKKREVDR